MKMYQWTVVFSVDPTWVADGFEMTDDRAHSMIQHEIMGSYDNEVVARVTRAPDPKQIQVEQGHQIEGYKPLCTNS